MASKAIVNPTSGAGSYLALAGKADVAAILRENVGPQGISPNDLDRIRVPAGGGLAWEITTLMGDTQVKEVTGVIIDYRDVRAYWSQPFEGGSQSPDCASVDSLIGVGEPGGNCATCPHAMWGSAGDGKKGQACRLMRLVLVLTPEELLPRVLVIPPSSYGVVRKFFLALASQAKRFSEVVTGFSLEKTKNDTGIAYSKVKARMIEPIDDATQAKVEAYRKAILPAFHAVKVDTADVVE